MTDYKELAARLRAEAGYWSKITHTVSGPALATTLNEVVAFIEAQQARIEALESERDEARQSWQEAIDMYQLEAARVGPAIAQLAAAEARCKRLEETLRPFEALYVESMRDYPDGTAKHDRPDDRQAWGFNNANLMWGDFRRARLALQEPKP